MFCTKCGKQLDEGMKFCTSCGAQVPVAKPQPKTDEVRETDEVRKLDESREAEEAVEAVEKPEAVDVIEADDVAETDKAVEEAAAQEAGETVALDSVAEEASYTENKTFDLPDSALEPQTSEPVESVESIETDANEVEVDTGDDVISDSAPATKKSSPKGVRNRVIAICSAVAVVLVAVIGVFVVLDPLNPNTPIDSETFPNDIIRGAVMEQLDEDGDGRLSAEEAAKVTALVYTSDGAQFVTDGEVADASAIREQIEQRAETDGNETTSNEEGDNTTVDITGEIFPNIKTIIADDSDLVSFDLSQLPDVEYVDLRGNANLKELDLSNNTQIKTLFCDEDTILTGLEEAGLYFTDLVTSMQISHNSQNSTIQVEYDSHARPIKANDVAYTYDDEGRLIHVEKADASEHAWFEDYTYGANGLLSNASAYWALDVSVSVNEYAYGYDESGRLTQFAQGKSELGSSEKTFTQAASFAYFDGMLAASKEMDGSTLFSMDENNRLVSACVSDSNSQTNISCEYAPSGVQQSYLKNYTSVDGSASASDIVTTYSEAGNPVKSTIPDGLTTASVTYECNADGYINTIQWGGSDAYMAGSTGKIAYVKRVGLLADRPSERYVPVIKPSLYTRDIFTQNSWSPLGNWFSSTGSELPISMLVYGPMIAVNEQLGIQSNMLSNPNELTLAAYDREHWADGLDLSAAQPIEAAGVSELLAKAEQTPLPVPAQSFIDDPVYGPVVKEYLEAQKQANSAGKSLSVGSLDRFAEIPQPVRMLMETNAIYSSDKIKALDFAYADLNADGVSELVVTFPRYYQYASKAADGSKEVNCVAVYGQVDGKPQLIANGAERLQCWVIANGDVVTYGGGGMYGAYSIYRWNGSEVQEAGKIEYDRVSSEGSETWDMTAKTDNGSVQNLTVPVGVLEQKIKELLGGNEYAQFAWTPIAVS